jgi:hypothetical protein
MNEQVKQILLKVATMAGEDGEYLPSLHTPEDIERFAELIVKECIDIVEFQYGGGNLMEDDTHNPEWDKAVECVSAMIRFRFGIK